MGRRFLTCLLALGWLASCEDEPNPPNGAVIVDARAIDAPASVDAATVDAPPANAETDAAIDALPVIRSEAELCVATGGSPSTAMCCTATADYPDQCSVGACGCPPANSHEVTVCSCPADSCFARTRGCVMRACTVGADQTCNADQTISSLRGRCLPDRTCVCLGGSTLDPATGKCR